MRWGAVGGVGLAIGVALMASHVVRGHRAAVPRAVDAQASGPTGEVVPAREYLDAKVSEAITASERPLHLARGLAELLDRTARLKETKLYVVDEASDRLLDVSSGDSLALDRRARTWLSANTAAIRAAHLGELRLGGLRDPVEKLVRSTGGDLVLPLVQRDRLIGVVTARGRIAPGRVGAALASAQDAVASILGELLLRAAVHEQAHVAAEVDAAASVQREAELGTTIEEVAGCRVVRYFAPAQQFSGAWWTTRELSDGRLFTALGEVTGRGVPAALLSAAAMGVCEAASRSLGGGVELHDLLELMHGSIAAAGRGTYAMSCVVALFDQDNGTVTFSSAGHPFPYLLGRSDGGTLRALVSRGSLLGGVDHPVHSLSSADLQPGDAIVFFTASLPDARSDDGTMFGERRLQRVLRRPPDGGHLVQVIGDEIESHIGGRALDADILVATVEVLA